MSGFDTEQDYERRHAARAGQVAALGARDARLGYVRLLLAIAAVALLWRWHTGSGPWWLALVPLACFVPVAVVHRRVAAGRETAKRAMAFYSAGLARMRDTWPGTGQQQPRGNFAGSLFAADLDLFGRTSLFALLSTARTRIGEDTLANWLLAPAPVATLRERHAAVTELRADRDLREDLAVLSPRRSIDSDPVALAGWAESPALLTHSAMRMVAPVLALAATATGLLWWIDGERLPFLLVLLVETVIFAAHRKRLEGIFGEANKALAGLALYRELLARLERGAFTAPLLQRLAADLQTGDAASKAIAKLERVGMYIDSRDNLFLRVLELPLLYSVQVAYAAEAWRHTHGAQVCRWLAALGEFEALLSLATYSDEHPADPFPEFTEGAPLFVAEALGHPLLPATRCVRNGVTLGEWAPVTLISGSNMSGKSTFLRTVGLNAVLAMAGAPVRAASLRMTPLAVGASILVNDSLAEGASRFYAEITRLREVCEQASPRLLFLLDELLEGTNSHDRQVGAAGILRTLANQGAIGIATTHDLALTHAEVAVRNMHFEDAVADGRMVFDYTLREGVVTRSNGVALMRLVGLDV